jgi:predicted PurR-regulated permease PerM
MLFDAHAGPGLHPLVIILGILIWSMLLPGLLGPVVAVPLTCAIVVVLRRYVWQPRRTALPATK